MFRRSLIALLAALWAIPALAYHLSDITFTYTATGIYNYQQQATVFNRGDTYFSGWCGNDGLVNTGEVYSSSNDVIAYTGNAGTSPGNMTSNHWTNLNPVVVASSGMNFVQDNSNQSTFGTFTEGDSPQSPSEGSNVNWKTAGLNCINVGGTDYMLWVAGRIIYPAVGNGWQQTSANAEVLTSSNHGTSWTPNPLSNTGGSGGGKAFHLTNTICGFGTTGMICPEFPSVSVTQPQGTMFMGFFHWGQGQSCQWSGFVGCAASSGPIVTTGWTATPSATTTSITNPGAVTGFEVIDNTYATPQIVGRVASVSGTGPYTITFVGTPIVSSGATDSISFTQLPDGAETYVYGLYPKGGLAYNDDQVALARAPIASLVSHFTVPTATDWQIYTGKADGSDCTSGGAWTTYAGVATPQIGTALYTDVGHLGATDATYLPNAGGGTTGIYVTFHGYWLGTLQSPPIATSGVTSPIGMEAWQAPTICGPWSMVRKWNAPANGFYFPEPIAGSMSANSATLLLAAAINYGSQSSSGTSFYQPFISTLNLTYALP